MNYKAIKISSSKAENILLDLFGISGAALALPGELDFNFWINSTDGEDYIIKVSRPDEDESYLDFQQQLLQYANQNGTNLNTPQAIKDKEGKLVSEFTDDAGLKRKVRLLSWVSGRLWSKVNPQLDDLRFSLGKQCGLLTAALTGFDHPSAHRQLDWDIAQSLWTVQHLKLFSDNQKEILDYFQQRFRSSLSDYDHLRKAVIHNDVNDNNIIVTNDLLNPKVKATIDYGDAIYTQVINDVAIACAYAILHHKDPLAAALPLINGYHNTCPLQEEELAHLYNAIAMRLVISVTKAAINKIKEPGNAYLLVSEKPAWELLEKWFHIDQEFAYASFRGACGYTAHPQQKSFEQWASKHTFQFSDLFPQVNRNEAELLDLSVSSKWIGHQEEFNDLEWFQFKIDKLQRAHPDKVIAGGYMEPRPIYTSSEFETIGNSGPESRSIHMGIDFWLPAGTVVHALLDGEVVIAVNNAAYKEYGGLVVLKHKTAELEFFTLYGHLSIESATRLNVGDIIKKGDKIAELGNRNENGEWAPHLHFQIMLSLLGYTDDFPGVTYFSQVDVWKSICPDPNLLFKSVALEGKASVSNDELIAFRKKHLGKGLSLQYKEPIKMVRGAGQYLMDQYGRKYLDTVNNVAHVGHEHYSVVKAGKEQMALINTNSRYLHENINALAEELMATLPAELSVLHFVNSGSEANELAIRMAKTYSAERDIIASEMGYHGNSNMCVDISSYKFDGEGGEGAPEHTHIIPLPDAFRGKYRGENTADQYAEEVRKQISKIQEKGRNVAAFIIEPIVSCGGQVELPEGFLAKAYDMVRAVGGLCISDEVQVGCGRVGKAFWGFQLHHVVPDIVTIGKPLGNGHPIAAVACTQEVADRFANGMEFFNTFGGNPVSCAIATEVLRIVKREGLQQHALEIGTYLKKELKKLSEDFPIIGDVRGEGLFLGIELTDTDLNPLPQQTKYLVGRMKDHSILMSLDGPDKNVLKIKPPLVFTKSNADELLLRLRQCLEEDFMQAVS